MHPMNNMSMPNDPVPIGKPAVSSVIDTMKPSFDCNKLFGGKYNVYLYLLSIAGFLLVLETFHDIGLSSLMTFSVLIQVVALGVLRIAIVSRSSVCGISLRSFQMQSVSLFCRLCSTFWLKGYIPVDSTGDWLYQLGDVSALLLCLEVCYFTAVKYRKSYQEAQDTFPFIQTGLGCFIMAILIHPDLNNRVFFDIMWTVALYIDVVSTLPQLWMMGKLGGRVEALSAHYIALIAVSRAVDMLFWYHGFGELAPDDGGFNLAGWTILGAHCLHILLMGDFIYCYVRAIWSGKLLDTHFDFGDIMIDV